MDYEYFTKLMELNKNGMLSDEDLAAALKVANSKTKKEETEEEKFDRRHEEIAEENRKHSQELRDRIAHREDVKERQNELDDAAIDDMVYLSEFRNKYGERVYSDEDLENMSYAEIGDIAHSIRNAKANIVEDKKEALAGFGPKAENKPVEEPKIQEPIATPLADEHEKELDEAYKTFANDLDGMGKSEEPSVDAIIDEVKGMSEEPVAESSVTPDVATPQEYVDAAKGKKTPAVDANPEKPKKVSALTRAGQKLMNIIKGKGAQILITAGAVVVAGALMTICGPLALGEIGAAGVIAGGIKEFNKGKNGR